MRYACTQFSVYNIKQNKKKKEISNCLFLHDLHLLSYCSLLQIFSTLILKNATLSESKLYLSQSKCTYLILSLRCSFITVYFMEIVSEKNAVHTN